MMNGKKIPYSRGLWIFIGYFAIRCLVVASAVLWLDRTNDFPKDEVLLTTAYTGILGEILAAGSAWLLVRHYYQSRTIAEESSAIGLFPISIRQSVVSVWGGVALGATAILLSTAFPSGSGAGGSVIDVYTMHGGALLYSWMIAGIVVAPFAEELLFRGVVFSIVSSHFNTFIGAVASVVLFMAIHVPQVTHHWTSAVAIFMLGVICAVVRVKRMPLWAAMIVHGTYNASLAAWVII